MSIFESIIGWSAPPSCLNCANEGAALCEDCSTSGIVPFGERCWSCNCLSPKNRTCVRCRANGSPNYVWITTNYDGLARELVTEYKFNHQRLAKLPMAEMMSNTLLSIDSRQTTLLCLPKQ
jgi:predicted amidophosphoribosyltransferase